MRSEAGEKPMLRMSTDALVYQALRHFRNGLVDYIRVALGRAFPDTSKEVLRKPFTAEEWAGMVASADGAAATGAVGRKPKDEFDYLGVNHFFGLFEANFKALVPSDELPSEEYLPKLRQQVLGWLREIKAVRDPVAHPPTEDLPVSDALRVTDSALRLLKFLRLEAATPVAEIYELLIDRAAEQSPPEILRPLDDTLPSRESVVMDFVGRKRELAALWTWLVDPGSYRWMLSGDGGKGKSAIAYQFAWDVRVAAPKPLCGVFWLSAKRRRYQEGAVVEIGNPDFWDLDSALNSILRSYGWSNEVQQSTAAKKLTVLGLLEELPSLLVVDDLDSIQPDAEDVIEFLTLEAPRAKSKVLITSRRQFLGMGKTCTVVEGLAPDSAQDFINSRIQLMRLDKTALTSKRRDEIVELSEGSPLYMEDLLRLTKFLPVPKAIEAWRQAPGDAVRRYALEREMEMLTPRAKQILEVCSVAPGAITLLELQRITGFSHDGVLFALDELTRMYLVPAPELIEDVPRFQVNRNLASLMRKSLEGTARLGQILNAIRAVSGDDPGVRHRSLVGDYCRQAKVLVDAGRQEEAERTLQAGLDKLPNEPTLLGMLGWVYRKWQPSRSADARAVWRRAYELGSREPSMYFHWSSMEGELSEWEQAVKVVDLGLERIGNENPTLLQQAGYVRSRFGQSLRSRFSEDRARQELEKADDILEHALAVARDKGASADVSRSFRGLVLNAKALGNQGLLCGRLLEWLRWSPTDPPALREAEWQKSSCPGLAPFLGAREG